MVLGVKVNASARTAPNVTQCLESVFVLQAGQELVAMNVSKKYSSSFLFYFHEILT